MKILVPIDGSEKSERALDYAMNLQQKLTDKNDDEKEVIILNVIPHFHVPLGFERPMRSLKTGNTVSLTEYIEEMNEAIKLEWIEKLLNYKKKYPLPDINIKTDILVGDGSITENIIKFAEKENVNMIIIGNIGLGGISKLRALGSVSRGVSEGASCPVLIVH